MRHEIVTCDRCHKEMPLDTRNPAMVITRFNIAGKHTMPTDTAYDLCESCAAEFRVFWKVEKPK